MKNKISSFFTGECKMNCFRNILFAAIAVMTMVLVSCYEPSPLYGKWSDNKGSYITFADDVHLSQVFMRVLILQHLLIIRENSLL